MTQNFRDHPSADSSLGEEDVEMNNEYLTLMEKCREKVFLIDKNGQITHSTQEITALFGFSKAEYRQLKIMNIVHPEDIQLAEEQMRQVLAVSGRTIEYRIRVLDNRGSYHWVEGRVTNLLEDEQVGALVSHFSEIDKKIHEEKEQALLIQNLTKRNLDLNQFVYIVSHNLRTPLSNLSGLIDILDIDHLNQHNKEIIDLFKTSTERLNETITDLTYILNRKNDQRVKISRINVSKIMDKVCSSFTEQIENLPIILHLNFTNKHVLFNKSYLESILTNLLSNAIKYRDQSRTLEIGVSLTTDQNGERVLKFSDNGLGIDLDTNQDELFGLHKRFHKHVNGNGVGLFITKAQLTSLGGNIEVSSKVNQGTTFSITFCNDLINQDLLAES